MTSNVQSEECTNASTRIRKIRLDPIVKGINSADALLGKELRKA